MKTLVDSVVWKAKEHPRLSRGMMASGSGFLANTLSATDSLLTNVVEECTVMTRRTLLSARTTVFGEVPFGRELKKP
jgi:hypothetical protein